MHAPFGLNVSLDGQPNGVPGTIMETENEWDDERFNEEATSQ